MNFAIFVFSNCHSCGMMILEDVIKPLYMEENKNGYYEHLSEGCL